MGAVTIKDIALKAGVSHSTVSRALRDHPAISAKTKAHIKKIARELGYVASAPARSLKTSRSRVLGVIVSRVADPFYSEVLDGIHEVVQARGYSFYLASSNHDAERERAIARSMAERRVEGIVLCSTSVSEEHKNQLASFGAPIVLVHNRSFEDSEHSIYHDDRYGSCQMTRHLIDLRHERIAFLGNERGGRVSEERLAGFADAMKSAGLPARKEMILAAPAGTPEGGALAAEGLLRMEQPPTALVCYNDMVAIGAMQTLKEADWRIPGDLSVVGFDNVSLSAFVTPPLTTFDQPKHQLGVEAAKMMMRLLGSEPSTQPDVVTLRGRILVRNSTASPPT